MEDSEIALCEVKREGSYYYIAMKKHNRLHRWANGQLSKRWEGKRRTRLLWALIWVAGGRLESIIPEVGFINKLKKKGNNGQ